MPAYYIGCDTTPSQTTNEIWVRCRTEQALVLTEAEVSLLYSPPISIAQANIIGGALFMTFFAFWKGKQILNLAGGSK